MKKHYLFLLLISMIILSGFVSADRLPFQVLENQTYTIDTTISALGIVEDGSSLSWSISNRGAIPSGRLGLYQIVASSVYEDSLMTNGGKIREVRNFDFISQNRGKTRYNIEGEKVLTYASVYGTHLIGNEEYTLQNTGNPTPRTEHIKCVFATESELNIPAFCSIVSEKSNLININSAKISTRGQIRSVGSSSIPAGLRYRILLTPDESYGTGYAEGLVSTKYSGSIMEARNYDSYRSTWYKPSADNTWEDATKVSGEIKKLQKTFVYNSGVVI